MSLPVAGEDLGGIKGIIGEGHDGAAEPPAAETGPDNAFPPLRGLPEKTDKGIQFGNTVLK